MRQPEIARDYVLQPINRGVPSTPGEQLLSRLADEAFFSLWSYPSVHRRSGSAQQPVIKEVADLLVYFEDTLVLVSEKDKHFSPTADTAVAWSRWARDSIAESASQLLSAHRHITKLREPLFLDRRAEHPFPFEIDRTSVRVHLIALCRNVSDAKAARAPDLCARSGNGLAFQANAGVGVVDQPFVVGDVDPAKHFVHVFDDESFHLVVKELGTLGDLLRYLDCRERAIRHGGLRRFDTESDVLASYLSVVDDLGNGDVQLRAPSGDGVAALQGEPWSSFIASAAYARWRFFQEAAVPWTEIAARFSKAIVEADVGEEAREGTVVTHSAALWLWVSENLYARAYLATQLLEKYRQVPSNCRSSRMVPSPCRPDRIYVFVFLPWLSAQESYAQYRHGRFALLRIYASGVSALMTEFREIVLLGAEPKGSRQNSETIFGALVEKSLTARQVEKIRWQLRKHNILTTFFVPPEDPVCGPASRDRTARGARPNDSCPCSSGLKFKRCCGK